MKSVGAECKRHKIKCEMKPGESSCTKCIRSGIKCVANDFSQRFVVDDAAYVPLHISIFEYSMLKMWQMENSSNGDNAAAAGSGIASSIP